MSIAPLPAFLVFASLGLVLYTYAGYPALLWLLARLLPSREADRGATAPRWPDVSVLLSAYNEELSIETRIRNLLEMDYPAGKCEIVIASDGSSDRTNDIVRRYADRGVRLLDFPNRRGKLDTAASPTLFVPIRRRIKFAPGVPAEYDRQTHLRNLASASASGKFPWLSATSARLSRVTANPWRSDGV